MQIDESRVYNPGKTSFLIPEEVCVTYKDVSLALSSITQRTNEHV